MWLALMLPIGSARFSAQTAERQGVTSAPVELPPMMVEESISSVPWLYVNAGGTEYLSRCSASTTRSFVEAVVARQQLVRVLVPEEFLPRMDVPSVCILYGQDVEQALSAEIQRELQVDEMRKSAGASETRVNVAPNMRITDRDMHATIAYIDETLFDSSTLSLAPGHVRFLLQRRLPELPAWVIEGVERAWSSADFIVEPVTLGPLIWLNRLESGALASDATHPRALLPARELFASEAERAAENRHARRLEARAGTQELFFRWATVSGGATRDAYWKLAARSAETTVTEELFESHFGFDFAELRDRLSDYLPKAVEETKRIAPAKLPPLPRIEVARADRNQIARVRGEWERLAIGHVRSRLPRVRDIYIAQARRTLRRAYDANDRDPQLLATMGLCEIDAGNDDGAREFLEPAVAAGVVRPRACYELARLRFAELRARAPGASSFPFPELAPVLQPLQLAVTQSPPLPEVFVLLAEAWAQCEMAPNTVELAELATGARLFPRRTNVALPIARALVRHGKKAEAAAVLDACADALMDATTRTEIARLRAELAEQP